jgi:anaerobic selenocysteine-containing dehydrogenase
MHTEPDFTLCRYLILFARRGTMVGHDTTRCAKAMADARARHEARGLRPIARRSRQADEWFPIRPGTDRVLALAMLNVLLNDLGIYDEAFVRAQTNSPYLVNWDGRYLREAETGKPLVWDEERRIACAYDAAPQAGVARRLPG